MSQDRGTASAPSPSGSVPPLARGLTRSQAAERLRVEGPNILPVAKGPPGWRKLLGQMVHFFALLLWVAGAFAIVGGMPALGGAIFVVILINGIVAFVQENRAERAAERLRDLLPRRAAVLRDGERVEIEAVDLVRDDLVLLSAGDRLSADLLLIEAHPVLQINSAALTGESVPVSAAVGAKLYAGSFVTEGEGRGVVVGTGANTRLAAIARLTRAEVRPPSPLARELRRVVRIIAAIALGLGGLFFGVALLVGIPATDGFLFAIGVTVALVPEALLPTVTLSLAIGAQRMARRNALVRRLESVETLGSTTFICTDKTGTLTQGEMAAVEVWTPTGIARISGNGYEPVGSIDAGAEVTETLKRVAEAAVSCSTGRAVERDGTWLAEGDPTEAALTTLAYRTGVDVRQAKAAAAAGRLFPFDPRRRRMSVATSDRVFAKGAPDAVLPICRAVAGAEAAVEAMSGRGLRVLAVAERDTGPGALPGTAEDAERDLVLLGLVGLEDPPRPGVAASIAACRRAGIKLAMMTGDHPATARAIAREVGLLGLSELVIRGVDLPRDPEALGALFDADGVVVSRVEPEDKLRIAQALRRRGHVVAMTGDGVNDGPALQAADIGVAMGKTGTDVAREAADLVLLDDDFSTIVIAIEYGRTTYANVRRFLTYHLTDNVAEVTPFLIWALSGGRFPLALGVLQILALDIGTDTFTAVALGAEAPVKGTLETPPPREHILNRSVLRRVFLVLGPAEAITSMAAFLATFLLAGWRPGEPFPAGAVLHTASGAAFMAVVFGQAANAFACRSTTRSAGALPLLGNPLLVAGIATGLLVAFACLYLPPVARLLGQAPPTAVGWIVALLAPVCVIAADAIEKRSHEPSEA